MVKKINIFNKNIQCKTELMERVNPIIKIIIIILVALTTSFDSKPYFSILLFIYLLIFVKLFSKIKLKEFFYKIRFVFIISLIYVAFIALGSFLDKRLINYEYILAIGFRFIIIAAYSYVFIITVNPKLMVISMIKYLKIPEKFGFSFLASYRFFPTFKQELEQIKFSHSVRGIGSNSIFASIKNFKRYTIPMLVTAVRKGTRISISMESRGFGKYKNRTYYEEPIITRVDVIVIITYFSLFIIGLILMIKFKLIKFSIIY